MLYINLSMQQIADGLAAIGYGNTQSTPNISYGATAPVTTVNGTLWYDTVNTLLKAYSGGIWITLNVPTTVITDISNAVTTANTANSNVNSLIQTYNASPLAHNSITTPINGQVLTYNGTTWVNSTPVAGITDHVLLANIGTNTHANIDTALTRLANTSGTNTGDEDITSIKTKLGITALSGSNTGDQDLSGYSLTTHNHTGTYEPADATILKSASIGVSVQGYDVNTAKLNTTQTFTNAQRGSINTITYGATITPDFAVANNFQCTLTGNVVVANPTNIVAGQYGKITLIQDATGTRTAGYGTYFKFAGGTAPTLVTTANSKTTYYYEVASATEIVITSVSDWK